MPALHAFLMTDIVGSTRATRADAGAMQTLLGEHDDALARAVTAAGGSVFKHTGDGVCAAFDDPAGAVTAAVGSQRSLVRLGVGVRMGIDVGVAHERGDDYFGLTLNRCARVMGLAHAGQILVTLAMEELLHDALPAGVSLRDLGLVGLRDFGVDTRLFQVVAAELPEEFPGLRSGRTLSRFPAARTALVGRARELAEIDRLVGSRRLVTLVGAGGSGKTRVALEVLANRHERFGGGAFADLSSITDAALVATTVAGAVEMPIGQPVSGRDLAAFLVDRSMLLVVDNCEHVADAAASLCDDLLDSCPGVALLCTSREPLRVAGEHVLRLDPLGVSDAAVLFADRAAGAGAHLGDRDRPLIEDICARLDGMPLAIEIAAAQAMHLPLSEIRALLDERFQLLVDSGRRGVPRHQTIEAALAWSYALLQPDEQRLMRQLSVFAASFTLSDAGAVAGLPNGATAARVLGSLVDKSLVVFEPSSGRYRLLETVRSFAAARLAEADETDTVLARLYDHLLAVAPGPWSCWLTMTPSVDVAVDIDNARRVLEWCVASGRPEAAAALAAANLLPWFVTGRTDEALRWISIPTEFDVTLGLDERLASRVAATWLAFPAMDVNRILAIGAHLELAPPDHPAQAPLLFLKAWGLDWRDHAACRRLLASVRTHRPDDTHWQHGCDRIEGFSLLLDDQPAEATPYFLSAAGRDPTTNARSCLAIAYHLDGRHDQVTAIVAELNSDDAHHTAYFSALIAELVVVAEAVGGDDLVGAGRALTDLLDQTAVSYPHMPTAYGFGVQAAAMVAYLARRPADAITLLSGSQHHRLHRRFEGAAALGDRYLRQAREMVSAAVARDAAERGAAMTMGGVVELARHVATQALAAELSPPTPSQ